MRCALGNPEGAGRLYKAVEQVGHLALPSTYGLEQGSCVIETSLLWPQTTLLRLSAGFRVHGISILSAYWLSCALPEAKQKLEFRFRACGSGM